jgi:predicted acetyltransferase
MSSDYLSLKIKAQSSIAGFALAKLNRQPTGPEGITPLEAHILEEFHILRPFRRKGIGTKAVWEILGSYPGKWIITSWPNEIRVAFWRHVLAKLRSGQGVEYCAGDHMGFPGQYVWVIESSKSDASDA